MKFTGHTFKYEKVSTGTKEYEIDHENPTYLQGKSGGDCFVAAFIPYWFPEHTEIDGEWVEVGTRFGGFNVSGITDSREIRIRSISASMLNNWDEFVGNLKSLPHHETIIEYFTRGEGYGAKKVDEVTYSGWVEKFRKLNG